MLKNLDKFIEDFNVAFRLEVTRIEVTAKKTVAGNINFKIGSRDASFDPDTGELTGAGTML